MTRVPDGGLIMDTVEGMKCRSCDNEATVAIRSGFESHPTCEDCAEWWAEHRREPLSTVDPNYRYDDDAMSEKPRDA